MKEKICPFSATLAKNEFGCTHAEPVIRRGGTEFACCSEPSHARCRALFERLKTVSLPAFGVEDDLTQMPQSVLVRIQFGGLLGLQRLLATPSQPGAGIADIDALLVSALAVYRTVDDLPCEQLVTDITGYRLSRRRRR